MVDTKTTKICVFDEWSVNNSENRIPESRLVRIELYRHDGLAFTTFKTKIKRNTIKKKKKEIIVNYEEKIMNCK